MIKELTGQKKKLLLSIYFGFHDSNITISSKKEILLHLEAERVYRKKHVRLETKEEMEDLVVRGLSYLKVGIEDFETLYLARWNNKLLPDKEGLVELLGKRFRPIMTSHHENHIGTSYPARFNDSIIVCADGGSEDGTSKIYYKKDNKIELIENLDQTPMTGRFFGTLTQLVINPHCSTAHNTDAGKTMGLAAYGNESKKMIGLIHRYEKELNNLYFDGCDNLREKFEISSNYERPQKDKRRVDLAFNGQGFWIKKFLKAITRHACLSKNVSLVGGCALNVTLNSEIVQCGKFQNVYIPPVPNDSGQSLGAILFHNPKIKCEYPFLGRAYGITKRMPAKLIDDLLREKIVAWYQDRSESGPRALGHRSFLGLPSSNKMKKQLSEIVKKREPYRPVAPIILENYLSKFFEPSIPSPFMSFSLNALKETQKVAPAVVHADGTSRAQTLKEKQNHILYEVLETLRKKTGAPILMNSSLNVMGEPIADTPEDAKRTFQNSQADILYINGERYEK